MLIGQSLLAITSGDTVYYTPWFPRGGNALTVVIEVLRSSGVPGTFNCQVQTKNQEDADSSATSVGSAIAVTASTTAYSTTRARRTEGCKELVRYAYSLKASVSTCWVHMRANPPIWEPN